MTNTALRAGAQSANNTHMVFADEEHEKFYYEKLEQARYQDCYHKALIYILGISEDTRNHFSQIYDMILSISVDTFFTRISIPKLQHPEIHNISVV